MPGYRIDRELAEFGEHVRGWRMVLGLTAQQVAERAGITRDTLRRVESGDAGVGFGILMAHIEVSAPAAVVDGTARIPGERRAQRTTSAG